VVHGPWNWVHGQFKRGNARGNNLERKKNRLESEAAITLIRRNIYWLRGRATAVTCTLILRLFKNQLRQTTRFAL
jgi:hypothetical protein